MTSPLVKPTSGYSTLSRLDKVSVWSPTFTVTFVDSRLTAYLVRRLVRPQPAPGRMAQPPVFRPLGEGDLADELRRHPARVLRLRSRHVVGERRGVACELRQVGLEVAQHLVGEPGADVTDVLQPAGPGHTDEQRTDQPVPPPLARLPAAD